MKAYVVTKEPDLEVAVYENKGDAISHVFKRVMYGEDLSSPECFMYSFGKNIQELSVNGKNWERMKFWGMDWSLVDEVSIRWDSGNMLVYRIHDKEVR